MEDLGQLAELKYGFAVGGSKLLPKFEKMGPNAEKKIKETVKKAILGKNSAFFIAVQNRQIIGFIEGAIQKRPSQYAQKRFGLVCNFMVEKRFQKKGIGKKMFKKLENWFQKQKAAYIELHAVKNKKKLSQMYPKWGFQAVETIFRKTIQDKNG